MSITYSWTFLKRAKPAFQAHVLFSPQRWRIVGCWLVYFPQNPEGIVVSVIFHTTAGQVMSDIWCGNDKIMLVPLITVLWVGAQLHILEPIGVQHCILLPDANDSHESSAQ
jgi:hypothetical protein